MSALARELKRFAVCLRDGLRLFHLAPAIPLLAVVFEFVQHVVEVRIGLFESRAAFNALTLDSTRMAFGYAKVAALWLSMLLATRFWANRAEERPWWSFATVAWRPLGIGLLLSILVSIPAAPGWGLAPGVFLALNLAIMAVTLPLAVLIVAGLVGDSEATLRGVYRHGWGKGLRMLLFLLAAVIPLLVLHYANHFSAFGQGPVVVWSLMAFDAVLVGAIAAIMGTIMHHGYAPPDLNRS
ncbi:hypothetical protein [Novosphingobium mangrovi (ex Huang et al. 2023)]|uniref:Beta-carotene 15,15'-monooxygenase n=1 Tax=Novosphingobium mangrovi (ex Huang et al. 2023) TaxID=2976432 RepID=A0ABT2I2L1_9SPHN|nr:hypothetical protein [Novosphingobium mangrovi (ex Huang et al. 2023)]MCT2399041.1 hypothetical protein [Novosphingobium mangrovi (ex Huang et al. 2023)]